MGAIMGLYIGGGILLAALAIPMILRKIKPNRLYGFRVPQTLADPVLWYDVNAYAGKRLLLAGIVIVLAAIALSFIPGISIDGYAMACLGVMVLVLGGGIVQSFLYLKKLVNRY